MSFVSLQKFRKNNYFGSMADHTKRSYYLEFEEKLFLQEKVLLPAWIGPFDGDCGCLDVLQLQRDIRVELLRCNG